MDDPDVEQSSKADFGSWVNGEVCEACDIGKTQAGPQLPCWLFGRGKAGHRSIKRKPKTPDRGKAGFSRSMGDIDVQKFIAWLV